MVIEEQREKATEEQREKATEEQREKATSNSGNGDSAREIEEQREKATSNSGNGDSGSNERKQKNVVGLGKQDRQSKQESNIKENDDDTDKKHKLELNEMGVYTDSELEIEEEPYSIKHIYYTSKDGKLEIAEEEILEGKAEDEIYIKEKEGFIYIADEEPDISYDTGLGMQVLSIKYYDEGAIELVEKAEIEEAKEEKMKKILIYSLIGGLVASGGGALLYIIYKRKNKIQN